MTDPDLPTRTEGEGETLDMPEGLGWFSKGQILGERYQIVEMLGRGGMGEVWKAFDLKLRVEVALKALRPDFFKSENRRELLRQEVRAAREVMSPNVCRIFDLIEIEGRELVSMEHVDGATLLGVLQERGPLELKEAQDIASQFLAGLEAIHKVGLVHRDIKPENIMLTRAGRVVVMDFGLARQEAEGGGSVSGTPAYMSPEQAAGETLDPRADVYSAGVVLAEMVSPDGIKNIQSRQSVWEGVRSEPAKIPETPWADVIKKAIAKDRDRRFNTAHTLTRALEDVTLRVEGAEDLHPYPGLASFTEEDAEYFFGREAEIEQMWRKLDRPHLLGIVGPSGAGKTSFIRAGVIPKAGSGWAIAVCSPGDAAFRSLRQELASELAGDAEAMRQLVDLEDLDATVSVVSRWRKQHDQALLIVDQFEELFTQNLPEIQERFAELLGRLVLEADVFVLLSMRDDFFFHCHQFEALTPVVADLTLLGPPTGPALRRALVQPANKCGYRFEDDELVDKMLSEVEGERGALPLLAFAAARLWEKRDRETGLLTRQAYEDIGGVAGALARHAEATIDRVGTEHIAIVRELFRNLVTAEGTRAIREWSELLSVFEESQREAAEEVLRELIDARLLTSYEVKEEDREPTRRIEIIHESLLANWPRLVRWQTQDADAVQLRDQLRQAAKTWDDQGRSDDTLWTGAAYREFASWRERYPGGLAETEEAFAGAMRAHARRRRTRRRIAVASAFLVMLVVLMVFAKLWRRSVLETRRAEAQELVALGNTQLEDYPTATLAHAIRSLEISDSTAGRHLAVKALWMGPAAMIVNEDPTRFVSFSMNGRWLVQRFFGEGTQHLRVMGVDGSTKILEMAHSGQLVGHFFNPHESRIFASYSREGQQGLHIAVWSAFDGKLLAETRVPRLPFTAWNSRGQHLTAHVDPAHPRLISVETQGFDGTVSRLGAVDFGHTWDEAWISEVQMDRRSGRWIGTVAEGNVLIAYIDEHGLSEPQRLGGIDSPINRIGYDTTGRHFLVTDRDGKIWIWDAIEKGPPAVLDVPAPVDVDEVGITAVIRNDFLLEAQYFNVERRAESLVWSLSTDPPTFLRRLDMESDGAGIAWVEPAVMAGVRLGPDQNIRLWPLAAPADAEPLLLRQSGQDIVTRQGIRGRFHRQGLWLAKGTSSGLTLWPTTRQYPSVIRRHMKATTVYDVAFDSQGRWVVSSSGDGTVRLWPLEGAVPTPGRILLEQYDDSSLAQLAISPDGRRLLVGTGFQKIVEFSIDGGNAQTLPGQFGLFPRPAFSHDGSLAATSASDNKGHEIHLWDTASWETTQVLSKPGSSFHRVQFDDRGRLLSAGNAGILRWDVDSGKAELLYEDVLSDFSSSSDGRRALVLKGEKGAPGRAAFVDLDSGVDIRLVSHGEWVTTIDLDAEGTVVATGGLDGLVRVGKATGEEPHLLFGHEQGVTSVAIDPLGRWIASCGHDATVRIWPMPDLSKPPLHTLPREELIAKLKTLTNLRVVRDEESPTSWKLTHDPFPGWAEVPEW